MSNLACYLHLPPEAEPPALDAMPPFRAVVIAEASVSPEWQAKVSAWLVQSGCLYALATGSNCSSWDTSIDVSNLEEFNFNEIPDDRFVMTTWHEEEPLSEVFWFAKNNAFHSFVPLEVTVLVHVAETSREAELLKAYAAA